jgi:hypothetical protein
MQLLLGHLERAFLGFLLGEEKIFLMVTVAVPDFMGAGCISVFGLH